MVRVAIPHGGKRGQVVLDTVGEFLQGALWNVTVDDEANHAVGVGHLPYLRPLGSPRERLNTPDRRFDIGQRTAHVRTDLTSTLTDAIPGAATDLTAFTSASLP